MGGLGGWGARVQGELYQECRGNCTRSAGGIVPRVQGELYQECRSQEHLERILLPRGFSGEMSSSLPGMGEAGIHLHRTPLVRYSTVQWALGVVYFYFQLQ